MALDQINQFMQAIRRLESGSAEGNYGAQGPKITNSKSQYAGERAFGAYQIMPGNWSSWARAAGLEGADIRDPKAQDTVARDRFAKLYNKYGSWDLVAVAWFAGEGNANKAAKRGVGALSNVSDGQEGFAGTSVPGYVSKIREFMGSGPSDSFEAAAQRSVEQGEVDPTLEPDPVSDPRVGAREVGLQTVRMLSGLVRENPGTGAHDAINRAMKLEA